MRAQDPDDEMVTIRVPRRAAAVMNAGLEIGTSPAALRGQLGLFTGVGALLLLSGIGGLVFSFLDHSGGISVPVDLIMSLAACCIGALFVAGAGAFRGAFRRKRLL